MTAERWRVVMTVLRQAVVIVMGLLIASAFLWLTFSDGAKAFMRWLKCLIDDTDPATLPIIVITLVAIVLGVLNSLVARIRNIGEEEIAPTDKRMRQQRREQHSKEAKRQITFDAVLAGVTLAAYLGVIAVDESLRSLTGKVALILALLPGVIGLCHHVFAVGRHFVRRQTTIEAYKEFRERYDRARRGDTEAASPLDELAKDDPEDYTPPLPQTFFASLLITAVFLVPASMTKHEFFLWPPDGAAYVQREPQQAGARCCLSGNQPQAGQGQPAKPTQASAADATIKAAQEAKAAEESKAKPGQAAATTDPKDKASQDQKKQLIAIVNGLFFAGLGAYVWTLYLLVTRINTGALTSRFLMNSAVRSAMGLAIGVLVAVAGKDMFGGDKVSGPMLLFVIGLLPQWALTTLRNKAKEWFGVKDDGCETLPLCLVDGLNDGLIDLLNELGVGDIEHLSNSDPGELTLQTLFPLSRIVDWIDQAVLIQEVRGDIVNFRKMGIACATDMMRLHGEFIGTIKLARLAVPPPKAPAPADGANNPAPAAAAPAPMYDPQAEARKVYASLASATARPEEALHAIGRKLYDNYLVTFLWNLWNMPGSIWTGWVAEVAEWMPAIFDAATATATDIAGMTLRPEPSWDGRIGVFRDGPLDTLPPEFIAAFPEHLRKELEKIGYTLKTDIDEKSLTDALSKAQWWRDIVQPIFPLVQPRTRKR